MKVLTKQCHSCRLHTLYTYIEFQIPHKEKNTRNHTVSENDIKRLHVFLLFIQFTTIIFLHFHITVDCKLMASRPCRSCGTTALCGIRHVTPDENIGSESIMSMSAQRLPLHIHEYQPDGMPSVLQLRYAAPHGRDMSRRLRDIPHATAICRVRADLGGKTFDRSRMEMSIKESCSLPGIRMSAKILHDMCPRVLKKEEKYL